MKDLASLIEADRRHLEALRRDLHQHPELGYEEHRTSGVVRRELERAGVQFAGDLAGGTGVLGFLPSTRHEDAPTVALRADMDALPIEERTGAGYSSENPGKMHACGHDGHTTILIGAARTLAQMDRPNNVLFVFQPAEEGGAGGKRMCEDGVLEGRQFGRAADRIFGLHCFPGLHVGEVSCRAGTMMANADTIRIKVYGKGGHAAMPHTGIDPIVVASHIVVAAQAIVSRSVDPLDAMVITFGQITGGTAHNIIPEHAELVGTVRTLRPDTRALAERRLQEVVQGVAQAHGATAHLEFDHGYPAVYNDPDLVDEFRQHVGETIMPDPLPVMGGEDFSFYGQHIPACFYWLGLMAEGQTSYPNLHAPEFDFNDAALPVGVRAMCRLATAPIG
jgi:amidohydrolase